MTVKTESLAFPVEDAARILGLGERMTWKLIEQGELLSFKVGRRRLVSKRALEDFVARREQEIES